MASPCTRCALRLQRQSHQSPLLQRPFSQSTAFSREFPTFNLSNNEDLNDILTTYRNKHLVPAFLTAREQKLIFSPTRKDYLKENPTTVTLGGEEIGLQWMDRRSDRPARKKLVTKALDLICESKDGRDWDNVAKLLQAMKEVHKKPVEEKLLDKLVRKAIHQGQLSHMMMILQHANKTGMSLKSEVVMATLVLGVRDMAQKSGWEKQHVTQALERMQRIAQLLESVEHGGGSRAGKADPRKSPFVLGVQLELLSVYAYKHSQGVDEHGTVSTYADRLLFSIPEEWLDASALETRLVLESRGQHHRFQQAVPILHGVFLANKLLGKKMPRAEKARQLIASYEARLSELATILEAKVPEKDTYDHAALEAWRRMIRD